MFETQVDEAKNLLTISYAGRVRLEEVTQCALEVSRLVTQLRPEFRLLTDMTRLEAMDRDCISQIKNVMDLCNDRGVKTVIRVVPDPHKDIGLNILSLFHYDRRVRVVTCQTLEEATQALT